jgi:hypothetical protein
MCGALKYERKNLCCWGGNTVSGTVVHLEDFISSEFWFHTVTINVKCNMLNSHVLSTNNTWIQNRHFVTRPLNYPGAWCTGCLLILHIYKNLIQASSVYLSLGTLPTENSHHRCYEGADKSLAL